MIEVRVKINAYYYDQSERGQVALEVRHLAQRIWVPCIRMQTTTHSQSRISLFDRADGRHHTTR